MERLEQPWKTVNHYLSAYGGHSAVAGRLSGALRRVGHTVQADEILSTMKTAGYDVRESDPFETAQRVFAINGTTDAPIIGRLQAVWSASRNAVLEVFPEPPGLPMNQTAYLNFVDGIYQSDAYHSLSIEGYRVSPELIERVISGAWDPAHHEADRQSRDALAARGYWQAFQKVKGTVSKVLAGGNAGAIARVDHREWHRELFEPCVASGLIPVSALAGYRSDAVYLRNSRYVPPRWEVVRDAMPALFDLIEVDLANARESQEAGRFYAAALAAARALLVVQRAQPKNDVETFTLFQNHFIEAGLIDASLAAVIASGARAATAANPAEKFDGLPADVITALAEDAHNRLWVGTDAGLAVWDEDHSVDLPILERFKDKNIAALFKDSQGRLWLGVTDAGGFLQTVFVKDADRARKLSVFDVRRERIPRGRRSRILRPVADRATSREYRRSNDEHHQSFHRCILIPWRCLFASFFRECGSHYSMIFIEKASGIRRQKNAWTSTCRRGKLSA